MEEPDFWMRPETVARFGGRDPDIHLMALLDEAPEASHLSTLDLGCAGGRNVTALMARGASVVALDSSPAMCLATRERAGGIVALGRMDDIPFGDAAFDLVVALGIYQQGQSGPEVRRAVAETGRVLRHGGRVLVAVFAREMLSPGAVAVGETGFLFDDPERGLVVRFTEPVLLDLFREAGLEAARPVEVRRADGANGPRVTLLALFRRVRSAS